MTTLLAIQDAICAEFAVTRNDLLSHRRPERIVLARHAAMWLARRLTPHSYMRIGWAFANRNHTTVMHAVERIEGLVARDAEWRRRLSAMELQLLSVEALDALDASEVVA